MSDLAFVQHAEIHWLFNVAHFSREPHKPLLALY
jgi:hypothetical protein